MALVFNGSSLNTPPPSSSTSLNGHAKHTTSTRSRPVDRPGKRKERSTDQQDLRLIDTSVLLHGRHLPPSPELTSNSGQSAGQDVSIRYGSQTPEPTPRTATSHAFPNRQTGLEVVIPIDTRVSCSIAGKGSRDEHSTGDGVVDRTVSERKMMGKIKKIKRTNAEHDTYSVPSSIARVMAGSKKVTTFESRNKSDPSSHRVEHLHKKPRLEEKKVKQDVKKASKGHSKHSTRDDATQRVRTPNTQNVVILNDGESNSKAPVSKPSKRLKLTLTSHGHSASSVSTVHSRNFSTSTTQVTKLPKHRGKTFTQLADRKVIKLETTRTNRSSDGTSDSKRLRAKDPIKYYAKRPPTLKAPGGASSGPKGKGKATRKKIVDGESSVARSRQPSPFPAWHRTTAALTRFGVPQAETREVDEIPEDNCYILIPIYEAKTKLTQPELIPDRFDVRSSHPALQVNELLRRGMPRACRWKGCDAVLACETMLDKHINRCGHVKKALIIPREFHEPAAWICQWDGCSGKAYAHEMELDQHVKAVHVAANLQCPYMGCEEAPEGYEKMSLLVAHVRKSHPTDGLGAVQHRPLIGANDNKAPPQRHADLVPRKSVIHKSLYIPVSRAVWRYEQRKRAVIDLVSDLSFIDKLDVKMQAGNLEMNINSRGSDPENNDSTDDEELDGFVPEAEEVWLDREPTSELGSDEADMREDSVGVVPVNGEMPVTDSGEASRTATPNRDMQKRRSTRRIEKGQKKMESAATKPLGDPRDMGYCVLIPVTREWVALPDGPESM